MPRLLLVLIVVFSFGCVHKEVDKCETANPHAECPKCVTDSPDPSCPNYVAPADMGADTSMPGDVGGDMGPGDMTTPEDMGPDVDPNACDPACEAPTAVCDEGVCVECATNANCDVDLICDPATQTCVGCLANADCTDGVCKTDENRCVQCIEASDCGAGQCFEDRCVACFEDSHCGQQRCLIDSADATNNACVDCLDLNDCTDAAASRCGASNTCEACVDDADCADISNRCDAGVCVECTIATEATDCSGKSCDFRSGDCLLIPQPSTDSRKVSYIAAVGVIGGRLHYDGTPADTHKPGVFAVLPTGSVGCHFNPWVLASFLKEVGVAKFPGTPPWSTTW